MSDLSDLVVPAAVTAGFTLLVAAVVGTVKWVAAHRSDQLKLDATIGITSGLDVLSAIGCTCLHVCLRCRSKRPARIEDAWISVQNDLVIAAFGKAFDPPLEHDPAPGAPVPEYVVSLTALRSDGPITVLERDMAIDLYLPIQTPGLPLFVEAPSESVAIGVTLEGGERYVVLRGLRIQSTIRSLIETWGDAIQTLKIKLRVAVRCVARGCPPAGPVGQVNARPVHLWTPPPDA